MGTFQDQSHIDQVRDALWASYGSGASVMIGSGFSRNALSIVPGINSLPLWHEVAHEINDKLYPRSGDVDCQNEISTTIAADSILGLAQEYKTAFGRANLHQLLQQLIRDDDFHPGEMHFANAETSLV